MTLTAPAPGVNRADLRQLRLLLDRRAPGVTAHLSIAQAETAPTVVVHLISVPRTQRGFGLGQRVLDLICQTADARQWKLALTPVSDFGSDLPRLTAWYARAGFSPAPLAGQKMTRHPR